MNRSLGHTRRRWTDVLRTLRARGIALGVAALVCVGVGAGYDTFSAYRADMLQADGASLDETHDHAVDLRGGMRAQQAALRGYAVAGDPRFAKAYERARADTAEARQALAEDADGVPRQYQEVVPAITAWESWAEATRQRIDAGERAGPETAAAEAQGQDLFDAFEAREDQLLEATTQVREQNEQDVHQALQRSMVVAIVSGVLAFCLLLALVGLLIAFVLQPLTRLSATAERLAARAKVSIPWIRRRDEIGVLARSLQEWVQAEGTREAIIEQSPAGIVVMGTDGRFLRANDSFLRLTRCGPDEIATMVAGDLVMPEDRDGALHQFRDLVEGRIDHMQRESRHLRCDGSWFWSSLSIAPVHGSDGSVTCYVAVAEDITERKEQLTRAAGVQRGLLPQGAPSLDGYDLAGACNSAQDVGGDFFDWYESRPDELTFSLGDVMGKGMPAAILMATARSALRTGGRLPSVEESAQVVADSLASDLEPLGSFVTLFHARLDAVSGEVTFVDAGHGMVVVVRADGTVRRPGGTDFPLGIEPGHRYTPSRVTLAGGDALVVFSDGVLDVHPELERSLEVIGDLVSGAETAAEMVERVLSGPGQPGDDVTVVALRRQSAAARRRTGPLEAAGVGARPS